MRNDKERLNNLRRAYGRLNEILNTPPRQIYSENFNLKKKVTELEHSKRSYKNQYNKWAGMARVLAEKLSDKNRITLCPPGDYIDTSSECATCEDKENKRVNCWIEYARSVYEQGQVEQG